MPLSLPDQLIELAEGFDFEVKAAQGAGGGGELPKDFWKTYSAFANTNGGVVILGVLEPKVRHFEVLGLRNPERMRVSVDQAIRGGESDCRNKALQNMFLLIGRGERAGSGVPTIFQNWVGKHWRKPDIWEEEIEPEQTLLTLRTESLLPEDAVASVLHRFGAAFQALDEVARLALVTVEVEGFVNHARLRQLCERHPHDLSRLLAQLVENGLLESDNRGRGTSYCFPGTGEKQVDRGTAGGFPLEGSSTHLESSSTHLEASSTHSESNPAPELDPALIQLAAPIRNSGKASQDLTRAVILQLCQGRFLTRQQLSGLLDRNPQSLQERFLRPLVRDKRLTLLYPHSPNHEQQAYRSNEEP